MKSKPILLTLCTPFFFFLVSVSTAHAGTTFASDTFTDTNGVLLENHVPDVGTSWTKGSGSGAGSLTINNNTIYAATDDNVRLWYIGATSASADYDVQATFFKPSWAVSPLVAGRISISAVTAYGLRCNDSSPEWTLYEWVNGTRTTLGTYAGDACSTAQVGRLSMSGNQISVYINDVLRIGPVTGSITAAGRAGVATLFTTANTGDNLDNWSAINPTTATAAATRIMRLFEGFKIRFVSGRIILHQKQ